MGSGTNSLRAWQREALNAYTAANKKDFTITATPGAGKTSFALTLAQELLKGKKITRIVVVCPTDHLRHQWSVAAAEKGLFLDSKAGNGRKVNPKADGYITTYAQVASKPVLHRNRTELPHRSFVIFDEIHHAGDGLSWGDALFEAFENAHRRLSLTGTPFRTSPWEKIPFMSYEEDNERSIAENGEGLVSCSDYAYTYGDALHDKVVRPIIFVAYSGTARWIDVDGETKAVELGQGNTKKDTENAWRASLNPKGSWVKDVLRAAKTRVDELRNTIMPDAGVLVLASDQNSARAYAQLIEKELSEKPVVVLSDDVYASKKIEQFNRSDDKFLVAVRMVSEGVDIPRLGVLVWLTSYQTPLFFAQAVGRVVRARNSKETGTVFLPTVPSLLGFASSMEEERRHVFLKKEQHDEDGAEEVVRDDDGKVFNKPEFLSAEARFGHVLVGGKPILPSTGVRGGKENIQPDTVNPTASPTNLFEITENADFDLSLGLPGLLTPEQETLLLAEKQLKEKLKSEPSTSLSQNDKTVRLVDVEKERNEVIEELNYLAKRVSSRTSKSLQDIRKTLLGIGEVGVKTHDASLKTLKERRDWLLAQLH